MFLDLPDVRWGPKLPQLVGQHHRNHMTPLLSVAREENLFGDFYHLETHERESQFCLGRLEAQLKDYDSQSPLQSIRPCDQVLANEI